MGRWSWSVALAFVVLLVSTHARASRVRFVSEASEPFNRRVVAELENLGFDVDQPIAVEEPLPGESVAIVHATNEPPQVEVWLVESAERVVLSNVIARDLADDDADSTRVAERLRALLQPLVGKSSATLPPVPEEPAPTPPPPAIATQPSDTAWKPATPERSPPPVMEESASVFGLEAGAFVHSQPGGAAVSVFASARYDFEHPLGARLFGAFPIAGTTIDEENASADVDARILGLALGVELLPPASDMRAFVGLGGGLAWLHANGKADPPLEARSVDEVTGLVYANGAFTFVVGNDVTLGLGVLLGLAVPRTDIAFRGERVATWGRPLVGGTLGLGYDL